MTGSVLIANGAGDSVSISCAAGERLISGGTNTAGVGVSAGWSIIRTNASGNTWSATARNDTGGPATLIAEAYCLQ